MLFTLCSSIFLVYILYYIYKFIFASSKIISKGKFVLISGCDSGFGRGLAIELDKQGFNVLAGVYLSESINKLQSELSPNASVFHLDITKEDNIDAVFDLVKTKTNTLHALVNNAGIATGGFIDWIPVSSVRQMMNVNFFGHVAMTKKFLPLLIARRNSRVVNMSSICGFLSLPGSSTYCASKYALESFSDCLRREMAPWGLRVSIVEPGTMRTAMTHNLEDFLKKIWFELPSDTQERWGQECFEKVLKLIIDSPFIRYSESADKVIQVLQHAVTSTAPKIRYRPGWQSSLVFYPLSLLPTWLVDQMFLFGFNVRPAGIKN